MLKHEGAAKLGLQWKEASNPFLQTAQPVVGLGADYHLPLPFWFRMDRLCCCAQALSISDWREGSVVPLAQAGTGCGWRRMRGSKQVASAPPSDHAVLPLCLQCPAEGIRRDLPNSTQLSGLSHTLSLG